MALPIRDERALKLAKKLAAWRGTTRRRWSTRSKAHWRARRAAGGAAGRHRREAKRLGNPKRGRPVTEQEIDELWGNE